MKYRNKECGYIVDVFHCDYDKTIPSWMRKKIDDGTMIEKNESGRAIYLFKTKYGTSVESVEGCWITYDGENMMMYSQDLFLDLFVAANLPTSYLCYSCDVIKPIPAHKENNSECVKAIAKKLFNELKDYIRNMTFDEFIEGLETKKK